MFEKKEIFSLSINQYRKKKKRTVNDNESIKEEQKRTPLHFYSFLCINVDQ